MEENMRPFLTQIRRLILVLARLVTKPFALPLESWDLELEQHEIDRQLAYGRD
jgi:hypothetical protein